MNGTDTTPRVFLVGLAVLVVGVAALAGMAAADEHGGEDDEWTVAFEGEVDVADDGGEGGFTCTGMPTDHDCDKGGDVDAGPGTVDYDGYNRGSLEEGSYEFEDRFVISDDDGNGVVVVVPCEFEDEAPEDNPCPPTVEEHEGDGQDDGGDGDRDGGDGADDSGNGSDASDDRRENGDDGGNANDEDNADDRRDGDDGDDEDGGDDGPVDADADVTVDPPSDGPLP